MRIILITLAAIAVALVRDTTLSAPSGTIKPSLSADEAIAGGVRFLVDHQHDDGSWSLQDGGSPIGTTGYALVALLNAGKRPDSSAEGQAVSRAIDFLVRSTRESGVIFSDAGGRFPLSLYDQASATVALARAALLMRNPKVMVCLRRSARFIISSQDRGGGWRYKPVAEDPPDLPVTALQICALCAARDVGVDVPADVLDRGIGFLRRCRDEQTGGFCYTINGHNPGFSRTAVAVCAMEWRGIPEDDVIKRGLDRLFVAPDLVEQREQGHWRAFGDYYATLACRRAGGAKWERRREQILAMLPASARRSDTGIFWKLDEVTPADSVLQTAMCVTQLALAQPKLAPRPVGRCSQSGIQQLNQPEEPKKPVITR